MPHEVPTAAVVVPLLIAGLAAVLWWLHRRGATTPWRILAGVAVCGYGAGVIANTVLPIYTERVSDYRPPWTVYLHLTPVAGYEVADFVQNVIVFLPLGVLLPIVFRTGSVLHVLVIGFLLSLTMELVQLANSVTGHGGHVCDINDLLSNTLGAPIGYGIFRAALLVPVVARLAAAATWPGPAESVEPGVTA
jgi:glycopeptide antibiotics resistance protein